jgi:predicted ArsR family transcriptional regulator
LAVAGPPAGHAIHYRPIAREQVLLWMHAQPSSVYCVELARAFGWRVARARRVLDSLEREGLLTSQHRKVGRSGNGRRYFRLAVLLS